MKTQICIICNKRIGKNLCRLCGRIVCDEDFDAKKSMCRLCISGKTVH